MITLFLPGTGNVSFESDDYEFAKLMLADTDGSWETARDVIKDLASQHGMAKAVCLVINARRA